MFSKLALAILGLMACFPLSRLSAQTPTSNPLPLVVMGPPDIENGRCFRELFEHPDQWKNTRSVIDELPFPEHGFNDKNFTDDELKAWFAQMQKWGIKLELEVGAVKEWGITGEGTFKGERATWDRIVRLGGGRLIRLPWTNPSVSPSIYSNLQKPENTWLRKRPIS